MTSGICLPDRHSGVFSTSPILVWRLQDFLHHFLGHIVIADVGEAGAPGQHRTGPSSRNFIAIPLSRATMRVDNVALSCGYSDAVFSGSSNDIT
jgi:hypothetical protein